MAKTRPRPTGVHPEFYFDAHHRTLGYILSLLKDKEFFPSTSQMRPLDTYHDKGDEFLCKRISFQELNTKLSRRSIFWKQIFVAESIANVKTRNCRRMPRSPAPVLCTRKWALRMNRSLFTNSSWLLALVSDCNQLNVDLVGLEVCNLMAGQSDLAEPLHQKYADSECSFQGREQYGRRARGWAPRR